MSSALKNAIKRKTHKERAQPAARRKYGLLEKHKDYKLRAADYHKKEQALQVLRRKAEERNPDEFYFAMEKARTREGVHIGTQEAPQYSQEQLRLMKTQDIKYVALKAQQEARKVERLQRSLHFIGAPPVNQHTVFVDDEAEAASFRPEAHFDTPAELLGRTFNRPRRAQLEDQATVSGLADPAAPAEDDRMERRRRAAYRELQQRSERHSKLGQVAGEMTLQKHVMGKGSKRKLRQSETADGKAGPVFKWRKERAK